ncbi:PIN domain-containing protein [Methylopila jiangsuensis]|uniref:PIN domain-containing protein n=1 Tax=Methylopila jiangsuensis TaxID=586230 RepID=A0A9W6N239_9HYPH|nr:type II toxin-antitoxin system VapC family toxin [Methylopila jiangsuensis]MDR6287210.1 PIN domain nuclease of toxin-antitoxin system [Methylopila jiangsuensis]GLK74830.1 PIN domain-containing protein [Methylopila jiangsuensis]
MKTGVLLDTCAVIWVAEGADIAESALRLIETTLKSGAPVFVSPMTAWEVGLLAARGRIVLSRRPEDWFAAFMATAGVKAAPLSPDILIASSFLPGRPPNDPVDRIMAATARVLACPLVTRDRLLLGYGEEGHVRTAAC